MRILVSGGAGFIGSHLCDRLVHMGHHVTAADNFLLGKRSNVAHLRSSMFQLIEADIADEEQVYRLFEADRFECVFHFAANSDIAKSHADPSVDYLHTFKTTYTLVDAMRRYQVPQIVFASTSAIYGQVPGRIKEDHGPLNPISHYGAAKLASESFISSFVENYGLRAWIARFPNVVGERATHGAVFDFVNKLSRSPGKLAVLGNGTQVKPYLHVSDLLDAILLAWGRMREPLNIFNVGGSTRCTVKRMAEIVIEESGTAAAIEYSGGDRGWVGDVPNVEYDTDRIRALGWTPRLDSESAIRATARWLFGEQR